MPPLYLFTDGPEMALNTYACAEVETDMFTTSRHLGDAWKHEKIATNHFYCFIQRWYFLHAGKSCGGNIIHGFKEIRYNKESMLKFIKKVFPCSKIVLNYRRDVGAIKQSRRKWFHGKGAQSRDLDKQVQSLQKFHEDRLKFKDTFLMPLEDFSKEKFNALLRWVGIKGCNYTDVLHENHDGYKPDHRSVLKCA
eukprot:scaffold1382_cov429-Prasinococcus_capsulatus_cf.AAC.8